MDLLKSLVIVFLVTILFVACTAEPERIVETVVHEATVQVEVTREIEVPIEVTRLVEATRLVEKEVMVEIPVEVTRLVEREIIVTATPELTAEATSPPMVDEPAAPVSSNPAGLETDLLDSMQQLASNIASFVHFYTRISFNQLVDCSEAVQYYDRVLAAPEFNVSAASPEVQAAYAEYRTAIALFANTTSAVVDTCRTALADNPDAQFKFGVPEGGAGLAGLRSAESHINAGINIMYGVTGN